MKGNFDNTRSEPSRSKHLLPLLLLGLLTVCAGIFVGCANNAEQGDSQQEASAGATSPEEPPTTEEAAGTVNHEPSQQDENSGGAATAARESMAEEVGEMSLREMVGQMFVVSVTGTEPDYYIEKMIQERNVGGVLLFGYNMQSGVQTQTLVDSLQGLALGTEPAIPLFVAVDQEGGEIASAPWVTPQPPAAEIGARGNLEEVRRVSEQIGTELREVGVNTNFAPIVDTGFGAAIGVRSYGEDPALVSQMGAAAVEGFEEAGVVSAAKHFPNHGVATVDSHVGFPVVEHDLETILSYDLPPFRAAVEAGVPMVMVGHLVYPAIDSERPASLSPQAIRLLREELDFDGVVVTDDLSMAAASGEGSPAEAAVAAVKAGNDLMILSGSAQEQADAYEAVLAAIESGEIPEEQVKRSVARIVKTKLNYIPY